MLKYLSSYTFLSLFEEITRSQSRTLCFFRYFFVKYFRYLNQTRKKNRCLAVEKPKIKQHCQQQQLKQFFSNRHNNTWDNIEESPITLKSTPGNCPTVYTNNTLIKNATRQFKWTEDYPNTPKNQNYVNRGLRMLMNCHIRYLPFAYNHD